MKIPALDLAKEFVVLSPNKQATTETFRPTLFEELDRLYDGFKGHELISLFSFDKSWSSWEAHPAGDEVVILLSGEATFILETPDGHQSVKLDTPGEYVIVPKGIWHTAQTTTPTRMVFITPGEGTRHRDASE